MRNFSRIALRSFLLFTIIIYGSQISAASDWPSWRGPNQNGVSDETGLVSSWSLEGENLIWRSDFSGRSTPVIMNGRVYALGRTGTDVDRSAILTCFDAGDGKVIWEERISLYHTTVPFTRVGWTHVVGDPETGNVYILGVGGVFRGYNGDGKLLWHRSLTEEFWMWSGYGGRTNNPIIDEDRVILTIANYGWGPEFGNWSHRFYAFDKHTGEIQWITAPGGRSKDLNTFSIPVVTVINGQRLLIHGNTDGGVYAINARTGKKIWGFNLSKRGVNVSPVVYNDKVYIGHSEENIDEATMGRLVCIDATGSGDVTKTHEKWRYAVGIGYTTPVIKNDRVYIVDNSANLICLDANTGKEFWIHNLGTVGKASPVWADGKIYVPELNGRFHILKPTDEGCEELDLTEIKLENGRGAEIYASPAVAYGRVYFPTEEGMYCIGDKSAPFSPTKPAMPDLNDGEAEKNAEIAHIQVSPAVKMIRSGESVNFKVRAFDERGRYVRDLKKGEFSLDGLQGKINKKGKFVSDKNSREHIGKVMVKSGDLEAVADIRVIPALPWSFDFNEMEDGVSPPSWVGANKKFVVRTIDDEKVLVKPRAPIGLHRTSAYFGPSTMKGYTVQTDALGTKDKRRIPDMGLIANGYILDLQGKLKKLEIRSWTSVLRMAKTEKFEFQPDTWYTMKMRVDYEGGKAIVKGKVWLRGETEPGEWTITAEDPHPILEGSPGLYGNSPSLVYYDNIKVTRSE